VFAFDDSYPTIGGRSADLPFASSDCGIKQVLGRLDYFKDSQFADKFEARAITVRGRSRRRLLLNVTKVLQAINEGLSTDAVLARKILQKPVIQKIKIVVTRQIGLDKFFRRQQ
jgi:hypothetical protein